MDWDVVGRGRWIGGRESKVGGWVVGKEGGWVGGYEVVVGGE